MKTPTQVIPAGCNGSTGIWRDGGGNNQSPFYVDEEVSRLTGLPNNSIVAITTFSLNNTRARPNPNATLRGFMALGIALNWSSPMVIKPAPLWALPKQNAYANTSVLTDPFSGFGSEVRARGCTPRAAACPAHARRPTSPPCPQRCARYAPPTAAAGPVLVL